MIPTLRIRWGNLNNIIDKLCTDLLNKQLRHLEPLAIWRPSVWSCLHSSLFSPGIWKHLSSFLSLKHLFLWCHLTYNLFHILKTYYIPGTIHSKTFIFLSLFKIFEVTIIIPCSQRKSGSNQLRYSTIIKDLVFEPIPFYAR